MKNEKLSVFMQMHNGTRTGEGSFNGGLQKLFYLADMSNRRKLVAAFPEFFGNDLPEFGICKEIEIKKFNENLIKEYNDNISKKIITQREESRLVLESSVQVADLTQIVQTGSHDTNRENVSR